MQNAYCLIDDGRVRAEQDADRAVPWWSFTKTVLAAAALRLVEEGALRPDECIEGERFSLRQLLQHMAGVPDYGALAAYHQAVAAGETPWAFERLVAEVEAQQAPWAPGTVWAYSNVGYARVRRLVEAASGRDLNSALRKLVFEPLGVSGAKIARTRGDLLGVEMGAASGYDPGWVYHGLIVGPVTDAARLLDGLMSGRLLKPETLAAVREGYPLPQFARPPFAAPAYGLGLMVPTTPAGWRMEGHTGGGPGSQIAVYSASVEGRRRTAAWFDAAEGEACEERAFEMLRDGAAT